MPGLPSYFSVQGRDADAGDGTLAGRARQSAWPLISVTEAQEAVAREARRLLTWNCGGVAYLGAETVHYRGAEGRVLTHDVVARDPLPPFPASTKVRTDREENSETFVRIGWIRRDSS